MYGDKYWYVGGERFWVAPEFAFFVKERKRFDDTYVFPPEIDPGNYIVYREEFGRTVLTQNVDARVYESPFDSKQFSMKHLIEPAKDVLEKSGYEELLSRVAHCGYRQTFSLIDLSLQKNMYLESWILLQVNPGGTVLIPYVGDFEYLDYNDPMGDLQKVFEGYVNKYPDGRYYLIVRNYYNDLANPYCCEPWHQPGENGCSFYIYNDDGSNCNAEFENSCATIGGDTNRVYDERRMSQWIYLGEKKDIEQLIKIYLWISYEIPF